MLKQIKGQPERKFLIVHVFACHGIQMDGKQMAVINDWEKSTTFYKMWPAEADIRDGAKKYSNGYFIGFFACCREIFNPKRHRDLIGGTEIQANVDFATRVREDELKAQATEEQAKTDAE